MQQANKARRYIHVRMNLGHPAAAGMGHPAAEGSVFCLENDRGRQGRQGIRERSSGLRTRVHVAMKV